MSSLEQNQQQQTTKPHTLKTLRVQFTCNGKLSERLQKAIKVKGLRDSEIAKIALDEYLTKNNF